MPGTPERLAGIVARSLRYIASGSSTFSPSLNAVVGRGRADEHVGALERRVEVARDERAHLLGLAVVGVVVAARQRVGAEDDAALHLVAEAGLAGGAHDVLRARVAGRGHPEPVAHRVEAGQVGRRLGRQDQVVRREGVHEVGARHLDHLRPGLGHQLDRLAEPGEDTRLVALAAELGHDADAQPRQVAVGSSARGVDEPGDRLLDAGGVERVVAADDLVEQGRVEHGPGHRAGLVEGVRQGDEAVARHPAVRRLHADRAGDRTGLADRAAGVGADRQGRLVGRHRGRAAAARAAGDAGQVPRVVGRTVGAVLGGGAHRELVHVGLAEDRQAGRAEPSHDRGVVRRDPALEDPRPAGRGEPTGGEHVLDGDRYAVEGAGR